MTEKPFIRYALDNGLRRMWILDDWTQDEKSPMGHHSMQGWASDSKFIVYQEQTDAEGELIAWDVFVPVSESIETDATLAALTGYLYPNDK